MLALMFADKLRGRLFFPFTTLGRRPLPRGAAPLSLSAPLRDIEVGCTLIFPLPPDPPLLITEHMLCNMEFS